MVSIDGIVTQNKKEEKNRQWGYDHSGKVDGNLTVTVVSVDSLFYWLYTYCEIQLSRIITTMIFLEDSLF